MDDEARTLDEAIVFVERKGELESLSFPKNELIFEPKPKPFVEDDVHAF